VDAGPPILCESCGYDLDSLDSSGACPECGTPIADSLPSHRPGSPWQQSRGLNGWWRTAKLSLFHPRRLFSEIRMERPRSQRLYYFNCTLATLILLLPTALFLFGSSVIRIQTAPGTFIVLAGRGGWWSLMAFAPYTAMIIDQLTTPPMYRRWYGWRITPTVYRAVRGHLSYGWIAFAAIIVILAMTEETALRTAAAAAPTNLTATFVEATQSAGWLAFLAAVGYVAWLEYVGLKRCRFASERCQGDEVPRCQGEESKHPTP
jgi:hypothetical protein